jgi:hypothetical protein
MIPVSISVTVEGQLSEAEKILLGAVNDTYDRLGRFLQSGVREKVRYFQGFEKRGVKREVRGVGLNKFLAIYGELVQHKIDEYGLEPGIFPPWGPGTLIYLWASRVRPRIGPTDRRASHVRSRHAGSAKGGRVGGDHKSSKSRRQHKAGPTGVRLVGAAVRAAKLRDSEARSLSFLIARGIFESGISAGSPFSRTLEENEAHIMDELRSTFQKAVAQINS